MEYWVHKGDDSLILRTDRCRPYKNRCQSNKPNIPPFQSSSGGSAIFHHSAPACSRFTA